MQMRYFWVGLLILLCAVVAVAEESEKKQGAPAKNAPPPMLVAVEAIVEGTAEPLQEMVGTVYYSRVSKVAAEVSGLVASVAVEDGDRVKKGSPLVSLQTDILDTSIVKTRNSFEQSVIDMEQAHKDLVRLESLYDDKLIAETTYDNQLATAHGLEKVSSGIQADLDRLLLEKEKMTIRSPFSGVVLSRKVEKGEWVSVGGTVAEVADNREIDIIVDIPARVIGFLEKGRNVQVVVGDKELTGRYVAMVPKGDVATRTFAIKIRMKNTERLIEGMEAYASLPSGPKLDSLLVPRDAVVKQFGQQILFLADGGQAKMVPVQVSGYQGMQVAVSGPGLAVGQNVVTKGNERIRDGQPVRF